MASTPVYVSQGTGFNVQSATTAFVTFPADVSVSDLALLALYVKNDGSGTLTTTDTYAWTTLGPRSANGLDNMKVLYRVCDGTEDGGTVQVNSGGTQGRRGAQIFLFRGDVGGTWKFDVNGATTGSAFMGFESNGVDWNSLGISCSGNNRLLLNLVGFSLRHAVCSSLSGESGAVWDQETTAVFYDGGNNPTFELHLASLTTSGSITGGNAGYSHTGGLIIMATGIWTSVAAGGATTLTAAGLACGAGFGGAPIICPVGFHPWIIPQPAAYARALWPW